MYKPLGFETHRRHIHLDFHTSPLIPDVAAEFDAKEFARTLKKAHVDSICVFAKCHHGQSYYRTKVGVMHPALKGRDLLGEMLEALHREGIRAPIYTTVAWEEDSATKHPEWRQIRKDGRFAKLNRPGGWQFLNYLHPDYQDYMEAHLRELLKGYDCDGFFIDILFMDNDCCWSEPSIKFREKHGLMGTDRETQARFESLSQLAFAKRFTKVIRSLSKDCTIFYNAPNPVYSDSSTGIRPRYPYSTHWEIESLPSGFWGYFHFPRLARMIGQWEKPWLGMTGRFQTMWGDFGGVKPVPALEYECFRTQAMGGVCCTGDQLPPRGTLDPAAYDLVGAVYKQLEETESIYVGTTAVPEVGILSPGHPSLDHHKTDLSVEAAVQICDEFHYESAVLDDACDLKPYKLLILPDTVLMTEKLQARLSKYIEAGGKLLLSGISGQDPRGRWSLPEIPLQFHGTVANHPTYWRAAKDFAFGYVGDRVVYSQGYNVTGPKLAKVLIERVLPYFGRTDLEFCSHAQTPPVAKANEFPAAIAGRNWVYFADPVFREYRQTGNIPVRDACVAAIRRLIGEAEIGDGLPTTVLSIPRRRGKDLVLTLLHYIPLRKSLDIDVIEERMTFAGETLRFRETVAEVRNALTDEPLANTDKGFALPAVKGRVILEVPGYFA